jgi:hypothetical protein
MAKPIRGADITGIDAQRLLAERVTRIRFPADKSGFLYGRLALQSQILGVGIRPGRPFETGGLDLSESHLQRPRETDDDFFLHLQ